MCGVPAGQAGFHDRQLQLGMFQADLLQQTLGSIAVAIVLRLTVLLHDRFRGERNDKPPVGMGHRHDQHLMVINDVAALVFALQTDRAMDFPGRTRPGAGCGTRDRPDVATAIRECITTTAPSPHATPCMRHATAGVCVSCMRVTAVVCGTTACAGAALVLVCVRIL